jgi:hypothetical protein
MNTKYVMQLSNFPSCAACAGQLVELVELFSATLEKSLEICGSSLCSC